LFTGDEGFVDFDASLFDLSVDDDLVTKREDEEVAFDDLVLEDLANLSFPDDGRLLLGEEAHFVNGSFRTDAIDDADAGVSDSDEDEEEVFVGANGDNHEGKDEVDEVENRKGISEDNPADGVGVFMRDMVNPALLDAGLDLFLRKTV